MSYLEQVSKELFEYKPALTKREDFDEFWEATIKKAKSVPLNSKMELYDYPSKYIKVYSISYNGFDDTRIHGWYIVPQFTDMKKLPCLINFHGFTGNRGMPADFMMWVMQGIAVISVDCREQSGETGNSAVYTSGSMQNVISKGLLDKNEYYFRAVYMDCLKAIDFAETCDKVDKDRIIIHGGSQGGALGMAVCALDSRPWLAMVDVPSNSNIEKRVEGSYGSFSSVNDYLKKYPDRTDRVFETLSYFDTMNMADRIKCKVLASVALNDNTCPAKLYFASYNRITSRKEIKIYPFNGHEGAKAVHNEVKLRFLADNLK
ncbi:MAG: acetylxylan esterase [Bacillota bacterium]|nr:acetylxylan esterase [Bacillota bacterium]